MLGSLIGWRRDRHCVSRKVRKIGGGWRCTGGSHYKSDGELGVCGIRPVGEGRVADIEAVVAWKSAKGRYEI